MQAVANAIDINNSVESPTRFQSLFHNFRRKRNRRTANEEKDIQVQNVQQNMEDLILEVHHDRLLAIKLKQVGDIDGIEIVHMSSRTLSTIYESNYCNGYAINQNDSDDSTELTIKNELFKSLPSAQWEETVERIILERKKDINCIPYKSALLHDTFDRRYGQETRDEAFQQLRILDEIGNTRKEEREPCDERDDTNLDLDDREAKVLGARGSQLRRRIFQMQRDFDVLVPIASY